MRQYYVCAILYICICMFERKSANKLEIQADLHQKLLEVYLKMYFIEVSLVAFHHQSSTKEVYVLQNIKQ